MPAGTSPKTVKRLNAEIAAIIRGPEAQDRWMKMGIDAVDNTPEQFSAWLARESEQWAKLIRDTGIKAE